MSLDGSLKIDEGSMDLIRDSLDASETYYNDRPVLLLIHLDMAAKNPCDSQTWPLTPGMT